MLIPREKPYLERLNSYYLDVDRFIQHLQGDIGSGCVYFKSSYHEVLIYFNEFEIIRGVVQETGKHAKASPSLQPVLDIICKTSYLVTVYSFDPNAIYFWGQMPSFRRAKKNLQSSDISLKDLVDRLSDKKFSGFIDVVLENGESGLIFFHQGDRMGGSYSWGVGGLNRASSEFDTLLDKIQQGGATYIIGNFVEEQVDILEQKPLKEAKKADSGGGKESAEGAGKAEKKSKPKKEVEPIPANLIPALMDFMNLYTEIIKKKAKDDPVILLKQQFIDNVHQYPYLDPFRGQFDYVDGKVKFAEGAPYKEIVAAVIACVWQLILQHKLEKKFVGGIEKLTFKPVFDKHGISLIL